MEKRKNLEKMAESMGKLKDGLMRTGLILQGTITERMIERKQRRGDRHGIRSVLEYGPYYQWTFKRKGKTVTVNLSGRQEKSFRKAIDENRRVENIISEMRDLSLEILILKTEGVKKRKRG
ncbi:MAG: hypothetical protein Q8O06_09460 [Acetobacterium sp.]|nr:hypothetical protein [Acetobacterium sp.]